jgi:hypothetical protein
VDSGTVCAATSAADAGPEPRERTGVSDRFPLATQRCADEVVAMPPLAQFGIAGELVEHASRLEHRRFFVDDRRQGFTQLRRHGFHLEVVHHHARPTRWLIF